MARTAASQAANAEFKSRRGHCGYRIKASTSDCGSEDPGSIPGSHLISPCTERKFDVQGVFMGQTGW